MVKKLCRDLDIPVEVIGAPTVRDAQGLAMSSRNAYLSPAELAVGRQLNTILRHAASALQLGADPGETLETARLHILEAGFGRVDYVEARESDTLAPWRRDRAGRILAAAWLGTTRLIDNIEVTGI